MNDLDCQIEDFAGKYLVDNPNRHLSISDVREDLERMLLPAGYVQYDDNRFNRCKLSGFYLRENEYSVGLFAVDNLFRDLFLEHGEPSAPPRPARTVDDLKRSFQEIALRAATRPPLPEPQYLSFVELSSLDDVRELVKKHFALHDIWEREGITHRGMTEIDANRPDYVKSRLIRQGLVGLFGGAAIGLSYGGYGTMAVGAVLGGVGLGGYSCFKDKKWLKSVDAERIKLKEEYARDLQRFMGDYYDRTVFDKAALMHALFTVITIRKEFPLLTTGED